MIFYTLGLLGTLAYFWPQLSAGLFFGDRGDARLAVYLCEHWYQAIQGRVSLLSPPMFYPLPDGLLRSDLLAGFALPYCGLRALGLDPFAALQAVVIGCTALAYLITYLLLQKGLEFRPGPAAVGAAFFAFSSPKLAQIGHLQLQSVYLLAACFLGLVGFARTSAPGWLALAALALTAQLLTSFYLGWFALFWLALWLGLAALQEPTRQRLRELAPRMGPGLVVTGAGLAGVAALYLPLLGQQPPFSYSEAMLAHWWSPLAMAEGNYLWGSLAARLPRPQGWWESVNGVGLVFSLGWLGVSLACLTPGRTPERCALRASVGATNLVYLLAMSYGGWSPWAWVHAWVPGAVAVRAAGRAMIVLSLPMAAGLAWLLQRGHPALLLLGLLGLAEQLGCGRGFPLAPERAYLDSTAARVPAGCTAFYVAVPPIDRFRGPDHQLDAMLIAQRCGRPTLNGYTGLMPPGWDLGDLSRPDLPLRVQRWVEGHGVKGGIFRLELWPSVESFK